MKIQILYSIEAKSGILIGSTSEILKIGLDKTTLRSRRINFSSNNDELPLSVVDGGPVIPGSTMKGKVRSECERILRSLGHPVCKSPSADTMCPHLSAPSLPATCEICSLFGGPNVKSNVFFSDAQLSSPDLVAVATIVQPGVAISRARRVAADERLFFLERGAEGLRYEGSVDGYLAFENVERQIALIVVAMENLLAIGGGKSRGSGWTKVTIEQITKDKEVIHGDSLAQIRGALTRWKELK